MIDALTRTRETLRESLSCARSSDIIISGYVDVPPAEVMLPAVLIKDGGQVREELAGGMIRYTNQVKISIFIQVVKEELALVGGSGVKGILEVEEDIDRILDENTMGSIEITEVVKLPQVTESRPVNDGKRDMQRKDIVYRVVRETTRPSVARTGG